MYKRTVVQLRFGSTPSNVGETPLATILRTLDLIFSITGALLITPHNIQVPESRASALQRPGRTASAIVFITAMFAVSSSDNGRVSFAARMTLVSPG